VDLFFILSSFSCNLLPFYFESGVFSAQRKEDWEGLIQHVAFASSSEAPLVLVQSELIEGKCQISISTNLGIF